MQHACKTVISLVAIVSVNDHACLRWHTVHSRHTCTPACKLGTVAGTWVDSLTFQQYVFGLLEGQTSKELFSTGCKYPEYAIYG